MRPLLISDIGRVDPEELCGEYMKLSPSDISAWCVCHDLEPNDSLEDRHIVSWVVATTDTQDAISVLIFILGYEEIEISNIIKPESGTHLYVDIGCSYQGERYRKQTTNINYLLRVFVYLQENLRLIWGSASGSIGGSRDDRNAYIGITSRVVVRSVIRPASTPVLLQPTSITLPSDLQVRVTAEL